MDHRVLVLTFPNKNAREYFVCAFFCTYARFFYANTCIYHFFCVILQQNLMQRRFL